MGIETGIKWCDHTFQAWIGCTKKSPGCDNCYAEEWDSRYNAGAHWGPGAPRKLMAEKYWKEPLKWNRMAREEGRRHRVFCASLSDVFDDEAPPEQRDRLWRLIKDTPGLDWLLLTKRPENFSKYLPSDWSTYYGASGRYYPNVWLGTTVENKAMAEERIPLLLEQEAAIRFLSCEPLLEGLNLYHMTGDPLCRKHSHDSGEICNAICRDKRIDWVIVGGESGVNAREFDMAWGRQILADCRKAGIPCFMKQMGAAPRWDADGSWWVDGKITKNGHPRFNDRKGGDSSEWPEDLRVQEFPR